jgi:hypothetical protein
LGWHSGVGTAAAVPSAQPLTRKRTVRREVGEQGERLTVYLADSGLGEAFVDFECDRVGRVHLPAKSRPTFDQPVAQLRRPLIRFWHNRCAGF